MNQYLLDTHTLIWYFESDPQLPDSVKRIIEDTNSEVFVSIATFWEMAIKIQLGKLKLTMPLRNYASEALNQRFQLLSISTEHIYSIEVLPLHHRDPFDRMLIAQSMHNNLIVLSGDTHFDEYAIRRIWI